MVSASNVWFLSATTRKETPKIMKFFKTRNHNFDLNKRTYVMGILNVTPDSFSDGGKYLSPEKAIERALKIQKEGADILDVGAQSTRPGFTKISPKEEWRRLEPVLEGISEKIHIPISIDTFYAEVAEKAIKYGVTIINDVSGCSDDKMFLLARIYSCGMIIVHNSANIQYIRNFFESKLQRALEIGVDHNQICFDPGIGFNKSRSQDIRVIKDLENIKIEDNAILLGVSRKRTVAYLSDQERMDKRLSGTVALNTFAQIHGADILRVHDVEEAVSAVKTVDRLIY